MQTRRNFTMPYWDLPDSAESRRQDGALVDLICRRAGGFRRVNFQNSLADHTRYAYGPGVEFEWDPTKSAATAESRGIDFTRAAEVFTGRLVEWIDDRHPYGEARFRAVGVSAGELLHVVYTRRGAVIRIISARRANRKGGTQWLSSA